MGDIQRCPFLTSSCLLAFVFAVHLCIMKSKQYKHKIAITLIAIVAVVSICFIQQKDWFTYEKPILKNVSLEVYKSNDYSSAIYKNATARVCITITKVSSKSRTIVWNKTFDAIELAQYPSLNEAVMEKVSINNVFDEKEHLEIRSTVSYYANGSVLEIKEGVLLPKGITDGTLTIPI